MKYPGVSDSGEHYLNIDEEIAIIRGKLEAARSKIRNARAILQPLARHDRTVRDALAALDGAVR